MTPFRRKDKKKTPKKDAKTKDEPERHPDYTYVRFMELTGLMDVTPISEEVRNGHLVVLDVSPIVKQGSELKLQLKRAVDQLRAVCYSVNGDIGQLGNRYILLTPAKIKIFREGPAEAEFSPEPPSTS